jgi:hypothetical protein
MPQLKEPIVTTRSTTSFISQIISAIFMGHAMTGGARFSRRDFESAALSNKDFQRRFR